MPLTDTSRMPFGEYKGKMMINVPAEYLLYYWEQDWIDSWPAVADYIEEHLEILKMEVQEHERRKTRG